jgi:hypothetical protein
MVRKDIIVFLFALTRTGCPMKISGTIARVAGASRGTGAAIAQA